MSDSRIAEPGIQVISRAMQILRVLRNEAKGLSLGKIATRTNLPRSTVQRIVNTLITERMVVSAARGNGLRIGPELRTFAHGQGKDVVERVRPVIAELSQLTGETVDFSVLCEGKMVFLDQVTGSHRLRTVSAVGEGFPLTTTANGKAALAQLAEGEAKKLIEREVSQTHTDLRIRVVFRELDACKRRGYAEDNDEHTAGISAVGSALTDQDGTVYAISVPVPTSRFKRVKAGVTKRLLQATDKVGALCGLTRVAA